MAFPVRACFCVVALGMSALASFRAGAGEVPAATRKILAAESLPVSLLDGIDDELRVPESLLAGARTKLTIAGKSAGRREIRVGMTCAAEYPEKQAEARKVDCN